MNEGEKQLLLTDLCSRLPYGVKGRVFTETSNGKYDINGDMIFIDEQFIVVLDQVNIQSEEIRLTAVGDEETVEFIDNEQDFGKPYCIEDFEPYLRPMSSMTEKEKKVYDKLRMNYYKLFSTESSSNLIDWLNSHYFDYRGLIEKGLALKAPDGMYNG